MRIEKISITRHQLLFGWLSFSLTVPNTYLLLGLPILMRQYGWSGTEIGLFQLIALPAVFKFILAIPIQHQTLSQRHYHHWLAWLIGLLILAIVLLAVKNWLFLPSIMFILGLITIFLITWADIPLNALLIQSIPRSQQLQSGSIRAVSLFLGAIVGSGVVLVMQHHFGWRAPLAFIAINLGFCLIIVLFLPTKMMVKPIIIKRQFKHIIYDWISFFQQSGVWQWSILLVTCFPIITAVWLYQKTFLIDIGLAPHYVAWIIGVGGGMVGAISSIISRIVFKPLSMSQILPICLSWSLCSFILLLLTIHFQLAIYWVIISLFFVASSMGIASALFLGLMFFFTRQEKRASDYGLQASLFVIARMLLPILAGILLDFGGYVLMLSFFTLSLFCLLLLTLITRHHFDSIIQKSLNQTH